jgi:hypothetical protein
VEKVPNCHPWVKLKTLIENDWSGSESHPVEYYLSKNLKLSAFKYT